MLGKKVNVAYHVFFSMRLQVWPLQSIFLFSRSLLSLVLYAVVGDPASPSFLMTGSSHPIHRPPSACSGGNGSIYLLPAHKKSQHIIA